ncbi:glyoxalase/bleomycin resistance protein/dioxygenase [Metarhizium brunneum]
MPQIIEAEPVFYISLSTLQLETATKFFRAIDFQQNMKWLFPKSTAFRLPGLSRNIALLLLEEDQFSQFVRPGTKVINSNEITEVIFTITKETKEEVDELVKTAAASGGKADPYTVETSGAQYGIYCRSFADIDGHLWESIANIDGHSMWESTSLQGENPENQGKLEDN